MSHSLRAFVPPVSLPTIKRRRVLSSPTSALKSPAAVGLATVLATTIYATPLAVHAQEAPTVPVQPAPPLQTLPATPSLLDLEDVLTAGERIRVQSRLNKVYNTSGFHISILTQSEATAPGRRIQSVFPQDERSVLIVAEPSSPNLLRFRVGEEVKKKLPPSFWNELANRYGNSFYVRDKGADTSLLETISAIEQCALPSATICKFVPGISNDQLFVSLCCAAFAGFIAGAVSRTGGSTFSARYVALFSPLWGIFFVSFALGPVVARIPGLSWQLAAVLASFMAPALVVWAWIPIGIGPPGDKAS
ncbi:methanol dehydrogenase [Gracilaria domingensis]|nr:methanol dehydrogenase [Gracilaria domingensis]